MKKKEIIELIELIDKTSVTRIHIKQKDSEIEIEKKIETVIHSPGSVSLSQPISATPAVALQAPSITPAEINNHHYITAPLVGTFYQSSSPEAQPFIKIGDQISEGDTVCIIEAMKLLNEVKSDISGKVVSIEVKNASPVEFGSILMAILPD